VAHWDPPQVPQSDGYGGVPLDCPRPELVEALNEFYERCTRRDVQVFLAFPPIARYSFAEVVGSTMAWGLVTVQPDWGLHLLRQALAERSPIPIITDPDQVLIPVEYLWDTPYHLSREGARVKTQVILDGLRPWVGLEPPRRPFEWSDVPR